MAMLIQLVDGVVGNKFTLDKQLHTLGRSSRCDIVIDDVAVSSQHATIAVKENDHFGGYCDFILRDNNSTNGTFVNEEQVKEYKLSHGDVLRIAWNTFRFIDDNELDFERTVRILPGSTL